MDDGDFSRLVRSGDVPCFNGVSGAMAESPWVSMGSTFGVVFRKEDGEFLDGDPEEFELDWGDMLAATIAPGRQARSISIFFSSRSFSH